MDTVSEGSWEHGAKEGERSQGFDGKKNSIHIKEAEKWLKRHYLFFLLPEGDIFKRYMTLAIFVSERMKDSSRFRERLSIPSG